MSRHTVDHSTGREGGRLKHYLEVEKSHGKEGTHPASKALSERPVARNNAARMREYMRIARGHSA